MSNIINASIDLSKIDKSLIVKGRNGAEYVNIAIYHNEEPDRYGNTHAIKQSAPRELRKPGLKTPYLGNGKTYESTSRPNNKVDDDDDIPF